MLTWSTGLGVGIGLRPADQVGYWGGQMRLNADGQDETRGVGQVMAQWFASGILSVAGLGLCRSGSTKTR